MRQSGARVWDVGQAGFVRQLHSLSRPLPSCHHCPGNSADTRPLFQKAIEQGSGKHAPEMENMNGKHADVSGGGIAGGLGRGDQDSTEHQRTSWVELQVGRPGESHLPTPYHLAWEGVA